MKRRTTASPDDVWAVLADGWSYPLWVVGASRMRAVSADWPQPGAKLHHSVGSWPGLLNDETAVVEMEPARRLRLSARARPFGEAVVDITLEPSGSGTEITMGEDVSAGPARLLPGLLRQVPILVRNRESLRRLALVAERHTEP